MFGELRYDITQWVSIVDDKRVSKNEKKNTKKHIELDPNNASDIKFTFPEVFCRTGRFRNPWHITKCKLLKDCQSLSSLGFTPWPSPRYNAANTARTINWTRHNHHLLPKPSSVSGDTANQRRVCSEVLQLLSAR